MDPFKPTLEQWFKQAVDHLLAGRWADAEAAYRRILAKRPDIAEAHLNLGMALLQQRKLNEAEKAYRRAVALAPTFAEAWNNLGNCLRESYKIDDAIECYRRSLKEKPGYPKPLDNLASALNDLGLLDESLASFDLATAALPDFPAVHSRRLWSLHFHPRFSPADIFREARAWNTRFAGPLAAAVSLHGNDRSLQRRLRIGYVSPDFRQHCQSLFTMPLLAHHDRQKFEIFCYSNVGKSDGVTARLRGHAHAWREIARLSDPAAAQLIRNDKIDILVDLALHTANNRLVLFAGKPAPIQVTWLGYPGTTGLDAVDYRLSDAILDPPANIPASKLSALPHEFGIKEPYYSERTVLLPDCYWCYDPRGMEDRPDVVLPEPGRLPASASRRVTFGCLNNFYKVSQPTLELWGRVLAAVPDSQLLMVAPQGSCRDRVVKALGVKPHRVNFVVYQSRRKYLETFRRIDLCLDTAPYNGGATSLEAMWMGVPVVTRVGSTVVGRAGWSLLHHLQLTDLVAQSDDQFVQIAAALAGDLDRLGALRASLRARMEQSPLMDGARFARNMEAAYRRMWQAWCSTPR